MDRATKAGVVRSATFLIGLALSAATLAQGAGVGLDHRPASVTRAQRGKALADSRAGSPHQAVAAALRNRGRSDAVLASLTEGTTSPGRAGASHLRLEQSVEGLKVHGAYAKAAFNSAGQLVHLIDHLAAVPAGALAPSRIDALTALRTAMAQLHPGVQADFRAVPGRGNTSVFEGGAFFHEQPSVTAVAIPLADGTMTRGWLVETWTQQTNQLHHTLVGGDGQILNVESRTASDSYKVFVEDPLKGPQTVVAGPGQTQESPAGWLGTGSQTTVNISGNNVSSYLDADANNRADKGGSAVASGNFLTSVDLNAAPNTTGNKAVAVQNLVYLNNVVHDILYRHGFNEAAGNFQTNNFGKGGAGADPVLAEAQDGSGTDNANFATPTDGRKPRMQMYLWTGSGPTHEVRVNSPIVATYGGNGAEFGPALTTTGITGAIVATTPADGCTAISTALSGKVALIDRGACDFSIKATNAQNAGAAAMIVANNTGGTVYFTMGAGANAQRVRIPSMMISQNDGAALRSLAAPNGTMRKKAQQPLQLDASLDSDIVFHEYGHGLSWRMIGGMSGPLAGAIGEGNSDGIAMLINGDDKIGEYSGSNPNGIRRYPYANYPLTYANVTGAEVHDDGEIYAAIIWRLMELFNGRTEELFSYVVDGMNYTPSTPAYEDMRDGILDAVANAPAVVVGDRCKVWQAFAQYGVGVGASGVVNTSTSVTITPSYESPGDCH
jgi:hypothetical protein